MTLSEYLKSKGVVMEVDIANLPDNMDIENFVQVMSGFNIVEQNVPPVVIKDTRENRKIMKKQYDQSQ